MRNRMRSGTVTQSVSSSIYYFSLIAFNDEGELLTLDEFGSKMSHSLSVEAVYTIWISIASALQYLANKGVVHRKINSSTVLIQEDDNHNQVS